MVFGMLILHKSSFLCAVLPQQRELSLLLLELAVLYEIEAVCKWAQFDFSILKNLQFGDVFTNLIRHG